jgi:Beta-propeller repeat
VSGGPALVRTFDTGKGTGTFTTGLAFDASKNLYVTDFNANDVTKFNSDGSLAGSFGTGYGTNPESIVFDSSGNAYVGQAGDSPGVQDGSQNILKFSPAGGSPIGTFTPAIENRGTDWIDLAPDGQTLYYTSEGTTVQTFNVSTNTQGPTFATGLPGTDAFAIKLLPGGGALVADTDRIVRLDSSGNVVQTYGQNASATWFSLTLDPNGTAFWAGDENTGQVTEFNISTGAVLNSFNTGLSPQTDIADGLAVAQNS